MNNNQVFYTSNNQKASVAVTQGKQFSVTESLMRSAVRHSYRALLFAHHGRGEAYSVEREQASDSLSSLHTMSTRIQGRAIGLPAGCHAADDIHNLSYFSRTGDLGGMVHLVQSRYPNAVVKNNLKGLDRAFYDGVPNSSLQHVFKFYEDFFKLYDHYSHLPSPFLVDSGAGLSHGIAREIALKTGDQRFYGMATSVEWDKQFRLLIEPATYLRSLPYSESYELQTYAERADPGYMLGIMFAYLSATHNGDQPANLVARDRTDPTKTKKIDHKFYMNLSVYNLGGYDYPVVSFGLYDRQQMSFAISQEMHRRMMQVYLISKS